MNNGSFYPYYRPKLSEKYLNTYFNKYSNVYDRYNSVSKGT